MIPSPTSPDIRKSLALPVILFLAARLMLVAGLPLVGLRGYGDFANFFGLAGLGRPFIDYWVEFPPLFPYLSRGLYLLAGGAEHIYTYLLVAVLSLAQAGSLALFWKLAMRIHQAPAAGRRGWAYFAFLSGLAYGWWYFDPLAVFCMLLGLYWLSEKRDTAAGVALGLGALTKFFPAFALASAWLYRPPRRALLATAVVLGLNLVVWGALWSRSPALTAASLGSQSAKGSWETAWALLDGNLHTGNFSSLDERFDPALAGQLRGNPPRLSPWLTLLPFAGLGLWSFVRLKNRAKQEVENPDPAADSAQVQISIAFLGFAWCLFLLWSPGYSPQWLLYLLPLVLLVLPERQALLMAIALALANLLEWPLLLSRGLFWTLWLTIPLRVFLLIVCALAFWRARKSQKEVDQNE